MDEGGNLLTGQVVDRQAYLLGPGQVEADGSRRVEGVGVVLCQAELTGPLLSR